MKNLPSIHETTNEGIKYQQIQTYGYNDGEWKLDIGSHRNVKKKLVNYGVMGVYVGKPKCSDLWEEDLENFDKVFNTLSNMCEITEE